MDLIVIIPIFGLGRRSSVLAHDRLRCVPGITLPPGDANQPFIAAVSEPSAVKKGVRWTLPWSCCNVLQPHRVLGSTF